MVLPRVVKVANEQEKGKVVEGGLFISRVALLVPLVALDDSSAHVMRSGRTYYDRCKEKGLGIKGQDWSTKTVQIYNNLEVILPDPQLPLHFQTQR